TITTVTNTDTTTSSPVTAPNFVVYTGSNYNTDQTGNNLNPVGNITLASGGTPGTTSAEGGMVEFYGKSISVGTVIQVNGGTIVLNAAGPGTTDGITLTGAQILARGTADAPGGQVTLQGGNGGIT